LLLFKRGKVLRAIEDGLKWKAAGMAILPDGSKYPPEGVFVSVPEISDKGQFELFLNALAVESAHLLGDARPPWVHLYGRGIYRLAIDRLRAVVQAACPSAKTLGMEIDPALLEPGAVAGYRSIGAGRFCFKAIAQCSGIDEPIRKARALGAFASAEICYGATMPGRAFLQTAERALSASPDQICLSDARSRGAFGAEILENAGQMCTAAGYQRRSAWVWSRSDDSFDTLGWMLSGKCACLGPGAVNLRTAAYANPPLGRWMAARLAGSYETACAGDNLEQWLSLAAGLYSLKLQREQIDSRLYRHAFALERMGIVDREGRPTSGWPMEVCHRAARAAWLALSGSAGDAPAERISAEAPISGEGE
jgi:hypothetical protein